MCSDKLTIFSFSTNLNPRNSVDWYLPCSASSGTTNRRTARKKSLWKFLIKPTIVSSVELGSKSIDLGQVAGRVGKDHVVEDHPENVQMEPVGPGEQVEQVFNVLPEGGEKLEIEDFGQVPEVVVVAQLVLLFLVQVLFV